MATTIYAGGWPEKSRHDKGSLGFRVSGSALSGHQYRFRVQDNNHKPSRAVDILLSLIPPEKDTIST